MPPRTSSAGPICRTLIAPLAADDGRCAAGRVMSAVVWIWALIKKPSRCTRPRYAATMPATEKRLTARDAGGRAHRLAFARVGVQRGNQCGQSRGELRRRNHVTFDAIVDHSRAPPISDRITGRPIDIASSAALEKDSTAVEGNTNTSIAASTGRTSSNLADEIHAIGNRQLAPRAAAIARAAGRRRRGPGARRRARRAGDAESSAAPPGSSRARAAPRCRSATRQASPRARRAAVWRLRMPRRARSERNRHRCR